MMILNSYRFGGGGAPPAAWLPTDLASLVAWYDASDLSTITESGGAVSQLDDKSGNNRHALNAVAANQPATGADTQNGLNVLLHNNDWLQTNNFAAPSGGIMFCFVGRLTTWSFTSACSLSFSDGTNRLDFRASNATEWQNRFNHNVDGVLSDTVTDWKDAYHIFIGIAPLGGSCKLYIDGNDVGIVSGTFSTAFSGSGGYVTIMNRNDLAPGRSPNGNFAESVISGETDTTSRQKLEGYHAHKWGLTANLPAAHPYKTVAP